MKRVKACEAQRVVILRRCRHSPSASTHLVGSFSNVAGGGAAANADSQGAGLGVMHA
jgi:hypothetical protein